MSEVILSAEQLRRRLLTLSTAIQEPYKIAFWEVEASHEALRVENAALRQQLKEEKQSSLIADSDMDDVDALLTEAGYGEGGPAAKACMILRNLKALISERDALRQRVERTEAEEAKTWKEFKELSIRSVSNVDRLLTERDTAVVKAQRYKAALEFYTVDEDGGDIAKAALAATPAPEQGSTDAEDTKRLNSILEKLPSRTPLRVGDGFIVRAVNGDWLVAFFNAEPAVKSSDGRSAIDAAMRSTDAEVQR